jgi:hypothetical protein
MLPRVGVLGLVLWGCGSGGSTTNPVDDAAPDMVVDAAVDAAVDAPPDTPPDGAGNTVKVITKGYGDLRLPDAIVPGIAIVSHRIDGTVLATATSDAQGIATIEVVPGGSVTAIYPLITPGDAWGGGLVTFVGVVAGDELLFQSFERMPPAGVGWSGEQPVSWPTFPGDVVSYGFTTSCDGTLVPAPMTSSSVLERERCHVEPMDVLFWANGPDGTAIACGEVKNTPFSATSPLTLASWHAPVTATLGVIYASYVIDDVTLVFSYIIDDRTQIGLQSKFGTPQGGMFSRMFPSCQFGDRIQAFAVLQRSDVRGRMELHEAFAPTQLTWSMSALTLPPYIESTSLAANAATGVVSWTLVPGFGDQSDAVTASVEFEQQLGGTPKTGTWQLVLPPNTTSVTLPTLPPMLAQYAPSGPIKVNSVETFDFHNTTDYATIRALGTGYALCPRCAFRRGIAPRGAISTGYFGFTFPID